MRVNFENVLNAAVIVTTLAVSYAVIERFVLPTFSSGRSATDYRPGDKVTGGLSELPLDHSKLTVLLVVSNHCRYCTDSAQFYRRLLASLAHAHGEAFQTIVLGATGAEDGNAFVATHLLRVDRVLPMPRDGWRKISGTPSLLLVDASGRVRGSWTGKLSSSSEHEVLEAISAGLLDNRSAPTSEGGTR